VKWLAIITIAIVGSRSAAADPPLARVVTVPTAWLPPEGTVIGTASLDRRGETAIDLAYGLGGLAAVELGADTDVRACAMPPCDADTLAQPIVLGRAAFRLGARQDMWFAGQPALVLGVRSTFSARRTPGFGKPRVGEAYLVASRQLGPVRLHAGATAIDAGTSSASGIVSRMGTKIRPIGGVEWTPGQYPKTTLMGDFAWTPRFEPTTPIPEWVFGWGVRYQALSWGSIELDVRHRDSSTGAEDFGATTVLVRVNGVWETVSPPRKSPSDVTRPR
jgi:hypothetical protein